MKIYLDPGFKNECTIWFGDGNIQTLKGFPEDICNRIREYVIRDEFDNEGKRIGRIQIADVHIDTMGIGMVYFNILDDMFVKMSKCTYKKYIK